MIKDGTDRFCGHVIIALSCLPYHQVYSRQLLRSALNSDSKILRSYSIEMIRVLLRINHSAFTEWCVDVIVSCIGDEENKELVENILDESFSFEKISCTIIEEHLNEWKSLNIFLRARACGIESSCRMLYKKGILSEELKLWQSKYNKIYTDRMEKKLMTFFKSEQFESGFDRPHTPYKNFNYLYTIPNIFQELCKHNFGAQLVSRQPCVKSACEIITNPHLNDVDKLKNALWLMGNIGSTGNGSQICTQDIIHRIVNLAEQFSIIQIRSTAFYVINLLSLSHFGAYNIQNYKWSCCLYTSKNIWAPCYLDCFYQISNCYQQVDTLSENDSKPIYNQPNVGKRTTRRSTADSGIDLNKYDSVQVKQLSTSDQKAIKYLIDNDVLLYGASEAIVRNDVLPEKTIRFLLTDEQRAISNYKTLTGLYSHDVFAAWLRKDIKAVQQNVKCCCQATENFPGLAQPANCNTILSKIDANYTAIDDRCRTRTTSTQDSYMSEKESIVSRASNPPKISSYKVNVEKFADEFSWASVYDLISRYLLSIDHQKCQNELKRQKLNLPLVFRSIENYLMICAVLNSTEPDEKSKRFIYSLFDDLDLTPFLVKLEKLKKMWSSEYPSSPLSE